MLEEKLKDAIIGELQRQAANRPQSLKIEGAKDAQGKDAKGSEELTVNGKIDLGALVMAIAGSVAGGP